MKHFEFTELCQVFKNGFYPGTDLLLVPQNTRHISIPFIAISYQSYFHIIHIYFPFYYNFWEVVCSFEEKFVIMSFTHIKNIPSQICKSYWISNWLPICSFHYISVW